MDVGGIGHHLAQDSQDVVDALGAELVAGAAGLVGQLGAEDEDVGLGDRADELVAEDREQVAVQGGVQHLDVRAAPLDLVLGQPGGDKVAEGGGGGRRRCRSCGDLRLRLRHWMTGALWLPRLEPRNQRAAREELAIDKCA